jgi:hypothetical protein
MAVNQTFISSAELNYPRIFPTLDLNFAQAKVLDPRITFTRSSGGSYVGVDGLIRYAGINEPRFDHDPTTSECLGLLTERVGTNLILRSEDFNDSYWTKIGTFINSDSIQSPNGTRTADTLVQDTSAGTHDLRRDYTLSGSTTYTYSVFLKIKEVDIARLSLGSGAFGSDVTAEYNLSFGTSTIITSGTSTTTKIVKYPNGWYRCSLTSTTISSPTNAITLVSLMRPGGISSYAGDGFSGIYVWGAQLESNPGATDIAPTSYIPTIASTRTRAQDTVQILGRNFSDFYTNDNSGSIFVSAKEYSGRNSSPFWFNGGSTNRGITYRRLGSNISFNVRSSTTDSIEVTVVDGVPINQINKVAASFSGRLLNVCSNGSSVQTSTSLVELKPIIDRLSIGFSQIGGTTPFYWYGHIQRLTYWNKILPNEQLQALTR